MRAYRLSWLAAALMILASGASLLAQPGAKLSDRGEAISLEGMVPLQFGSWREAPLAHQVVNPQLQGLLDKSYSQILNRTYVDASGYRIMLSLAYGNDQREREAHLPEVCYPAQGFVVQETRSALLATPAGSIPVRRLFATLGARHEPVTYWLTIGDTAVQGKLQKKLVQLRYGLTGLIPDGLLFRVSSIDPLPARAYEMQERFILELLLSVPPAERARLSGLTAS
jgi:EpsI family protein